MGDPKLSTDSVETIEPQDERLTRSWRTWYERSFVREVIRALGAVGFGDRIIIFGASLLL